MSLVAWYPLIANGKNQGLDGIDLTTVGTVTYTAGKLGNASTFTGNSSIRFRRVNFTEQTGWSVVAWVKCDTASSASQWAFNNGRDTNNDGWHCYFNAAGTTLYLRIGSSSWSMTSTLGTWYHVCMTIDNDAKYTYYVNGVQVGTGTVTTLPDYSESGNLMAIGGFVYNGGNIYPLNGQVQDFRYYNHVLSKKEVKELAKGLALHLPLDWGGNPNMVHDSYTWMNKNTASANSNFCTVTKSVIEDEYAPCKYVYKCQMANANTSNKTYVGGYFPRSVQGIELTDLTEDETYTYSFWAKGDASNTADITLSAQAVCEGQTLVSSTGFSALSTNWRKHTVTFRWTNTNKLTACFYVTIPASSTQTYYLCGLKLEKGDKDTPYVPNVSENAYIMGGYTNLVTQDTSGYSHNATNTACTVGDASPRNITGTNYIAKTSHFVMTGLNTTYTASTISIWAKLDSDSLSTSSNNTSNIVVLGNNTFQRFRVHTGGDGLWYYFNNGAISATFTVTNLLDNKWHHYVLTWEGGVGAKFYLDGSLINTTNNTSLTSITPTNNSWRLGEYSSDTETFDGQLSDFRFYTTALSADDVKELYQVSAQIDKSGKMYCSTYIEE